jgi:hypothetical protein
MKTGSKAKAAQVIRIIFSCNLAKQQFANGLFHTVYLLVVYSIALLIARSA